MMNRFSRRDFLKLAGAGASALALSRFDNVFAMPYTYAASPQFPAGDLLGRVAVTPNFYSTELKGSPDQLAPAIRNVNQDEVVIWNREVIGSDVAGRSNRKWVETPEGFIYSADLQPVRNLPNTPLAGMPAGKTGLWVEVTVPYVDLQLQNIPISPAMKFSVENNLPIRLYYGQVVWIDQINSDAGGRIFYRVNESPGHGYGYGDIFFADSSAFRVLTDEDVAPITPEVDPNTKKILVDATGERQYLACYEGNTEVYFCRISSGYGEKYSTPTGDQSISWKIFSIHMAANTGSDSGYDTMGVPWPTFFNTNAGAAIHGVFWHNDFGVRRSHGCINVLPEDAKWIFRWTAPVVSLDQSEVRMEWPIVGTPVSVGQLTT